MSGKKVHTQFAVLGLGRFGISIVQTLAEFDVNILACDKDEHALNQAMGYATHLVKIDVSDEYALLNLGLGDFDVVILGIGDDFEAVEIATMIAKESGAGYVIAKAQNSRQKKILESIGADEIILPEHEMGAKLARKLVSANIMDILGESDYYTITEMYPMEEWIGKTVSQADIRRKNNLTILAIRRGNRLTIPVTADNLIDKDDILIVLSQKNT